MSKWANKFQTNRVFMLVACIKYLNFFGVRNCGNTRKRKRAAVTYLRNTYKRIVFSVFLCHCIKYINLFGENCKVQRKKNDSQIQQSFTRFLFFFTSKDQMMLFPWQMMLVEGEVSEHLQYIQIQKIRNGYLLTFESGCSKPIKFCDRLPCYRDRRKGKMM